MRLFRYFGDDQEFSLMELAHEDKFPDEVFDAIANLQPGESVEVEDIGRIERLFGDLKLTHKTPIHPTDNPLAQG